MDGHSKLEFIDMKKTNITSILLSLHRFDKTVKTNIQDRQNGNLQNKTRTKQEKKGSIVAGSGNLQRFLSFFLFILRAFKFGRAAEKNRKGSSHIFKGLKKQTKQTYV